MVAVRFSAIARPDFVLLLCVIASLTTRILPPLLFLVQNIKNDLTFVNIWALKFLTTLTG